jgi:hypothetical protein
MPGLQTFILLVRQGAHAVVTFLRLTSELDLHDGILG